MVADTFRGIGRSRKKSGPSSSLSCASVSPPRRPLPPSPSSSQESSPTIWSDRHQVIRSMSHMSALLVQVLSGPESAERLKRHAPAQLQQVAPCRMSGIGVIKTSSKAVTVTQETYGVSLPKSIYHVAWFVNVLSILGKTPQTQPTATTLASNAALELTKGYMGQLVGANRICSLCNPRHHSSHQPSRARAREERVCQCLRCR